MLEIIDAGEASELLASTAFGVAATHAEDRLMISGIGVAEASGR
ncbi:hypothetical protein ACIA8K_09300 [Catenuloplanes sp. NPDC051500]